MPKVSNHPSQIPSRSFYGGYLCEDCGHYLKLSPDSECNSVKCQASKYSYEKGLTSGFIDSCILDEPAGTGQHTYEHYTQSSSQYLSAIYSFSPTDYQSGYSRGFDLAAIYTSASRGERWQDRGKDHNLVIIPAHDVQISIQNPDGSWSDITSYFESTDEPFSSPTTVSVGFKVNDINDLHCDDLLRPATTEDIQKIIEYRRLSGLEV